MIHRYCAGPVAIAALSLVACATSSTSNVYQDSSLAGTSYSNFLIIGVAGNYNSRAQFEREVVTRLQSRGLKAAAFHAVVGGDKPVDRESIRQALEGKSFDAVVLTRVLGTNVQGKLTEPATGTKVTRKEGNPLNLFRYDYEDLEDQPSLTTNTSVNTRTDLYSAAEGTLVWSMEANGKTFDNVGELIDSVADTVVKRLQHDGLLAR